MSGLNVWKQRDSIVSNVKNSVKIKLGALIHAREWASKGIFAVIDQALFSGSNFIVNILLARWLPPEEYGAFAVALSVFYLLAGFHTAVLTEPMMVFGAGKYSSCFPKYFRILLYGHWVIALLVVLLLGMAALIVREMSWIYLFYSLIGLALATPFMLYIWLLRRAFYVKKAPQRSALGMGLYLTIVVSIVAIVHALGILSPFSAFLAIGASSGIVGSILLGLLDVGVKRGEDQFTGRSVLQAHWVYGRWFILHNLVLWVFSDSIFIVLARFHGLDLTGVFRAFQNFTLPIFQFLTAWGLLVLPAAVRRYYREGQQGLRRVTLTFTAICFLSTSLYGIIVYTLRRPLVVFLLGEFYLPYAELLSIWLWGPVILALGRGAEVAVRVLELPQLIFYSYIAGTIAALGLFMLLIPPFGLWGAVWARIGSFGVQTFILLLMAARGLFPQPPKGGEL